MRKRYVFRDGHWVEFDPYALPESVAPTVFGDLPGYESPATGQWIEGRKARREDLKASGCRPWEGMQAERAEAAKYKAEEMQRRESILNESAHRAFYALSPSKRRLLERA